jgi:hypothetical protein
MYNLNLHIVLCAIYIFFSLPNSILANLKAS